MEVPVNWAAVIISAVVYMAIGFAWYSDALFGKPWRKLSGLGSGAAGKMEGDFIFKMVGLGLLSAAIMAYILSHNIVFAGSYMGTSGVMLGITTGFFNWLGYQLIIFINSYLYEQKPVKLVVINAGYLLVALIAMGVIIAVWR